MPDLTPMKIYACRSNKDWERKVKGSKGKIYTVRFNNFDHKFRDRVQFDFSCDCPSYKYHSGYCKHIKEVEKDLCGWTSMLDAQALINNQCPVCGDSVYSYTEWV